MITTLLVIMAIIVEIATLFMVYTMGKSNGFMEGVIWSIKENPIYINCNDEEENQEQVALSEQVEEEPERSIQEIKGDR